MNIYMDKLKLLQNLKHHQNALLYVDIYDTIPQKNQYFNSISHSASVNYMSDRSVSLQSARRHRALISGG